MNVIGRSWQKIHTYWKKLSVETRGSIAIAIPMTCLLGAVIADTLLRQQMLEARMYVARTNQVLVKSQSILVSLLNAETGVRGYYIGRQTTFLEPYNEAVATLEPTLVGLEQLIQNQPSQVERVKQLKQLARDRMRLLEGTIQRVETNVTSSPEVVVQRLTRGKQAMDKFRDVIAQIEVEESRLRETYTQSLRAQQSLNATVLWCGIAISLVGTAITIRLLRQLATELRQGEVRLSESRSLIETIVANTVDAVMVVNAQGQLETFNHAAMQMFDYTPDEIIGRPWQTLLTPTTDAKTRLTERIWQTMGQRKNGDRFPIEASLNDIANDDDRIIIVRDITDRQQAAAKLAAKANELAALNTSLEASNQALRQSNRELDQFAYITSHDLKAPLRAIASLSEWIEEDLEGSISSETRLQLNLLRRRVDRMQALLNSLLEYSRAGRKQAPITIVNLEHLLSEVIQAVAPPKTFTINVAAPLPTIATRRQPLQQVLGHLIDNAIRHHPTKMGIIEISVVDCGERYEFSIADNGDGIDLQFQSRIYTIFQTLKARDQQENAGAGLAIIKKIITAEGGTIRLESAVGSGATFRFTWPKHSVIAANTPCLNDDANCNAKHSTS
jgi:PAS domain S-box-containing protein